MVQIPSIYAKLKEELNGCDVVYIEPLSYMKLLMLDNQNEDTAQLKTNAKVILLCKKEYYLSKPNKLSPLLSLKPNGNMKKSDLNLTGSPLKDSCEIDYIDDLLEDGLISLNSWTDEEESYQCISLQAAQQMLTAANSMVKCETNCPVWAICGQNDSNILLTAIELNPDWNLRDVIYFNGVIDYSSINITELQKKHFSYIPRHNNNVETLIDSYFRISDNDRITLQITRTANGLLSQPVMTDYNKNARITLHQTVQIANNDSIAEEFWRQLTILDIIKENIVTFKESGNSKDLIYQVGTISDTDLTEVKQQVYEVMTEISSSAWQDTNDENASNNIETVVLKARQRDQLEVTDQLWTVLRRSSSYYDLKAALEYVFTCAAKYNVVNLPTNKNRLAELIREVSQQRIAIPRLNGSEPLELLLDIGLEKLTKDYEFIFSESKLCSSKDLHVIKSEKPAKFTDTRNYNVRKSLQGANLQNQEISEGFTEVPTAVQTQRKTLMHTRRTEEQTPEPIGFQNSHFIRHEIETKLGKLAQIHLVLEHLLMIRSNLNLENVYLTFLKDLQKPPKPFNWIKQQKTDERAISVSNEKILMKIENEDPYQQRIVMCSENEIRKVQNVFYNSIEPIFPPSVFTCMQSGETTAKRYYSHHYLQIGTRRR